eukprot:gene11109-23212_t
MTTSTKNHDEFSFEVGIAKRVDTDVIFSELISNKFFKSENALHSHMPYSVYHHDMIHLVDYKTAIIEPLSSIVHIINGKRKNNEDRIQKYNEWVLQNLKDKSDCDTFVLDEIVHDEMERLI